MITQARASLGCLLGILLSGVLQAQDLASPSLATDAKGLGGTVFLHETFEGHEIDGAPKVPQLQRVDLVTVADGNGRVGSGQVAHFNDSDTGRGGAMEYNVGASSQGAMYIEFDVQNNAPSSGDNSSSVIFAVGPWGPGKGLTLSANAKRAFGFEMYQQKYLKLRAGEQPIAVMQYDPAVPFNVKIWVNDHDGNTLSYKRPDTGESVMLNPDSVVVWVNNALLDKLEPAGSSMNQEITKGHAVIGRAGFSSSSTKVGDFLLDNLHLENPSGDLKPAEAGVVTPSPNVGTLEEVTPQSMPGAETKVYREGKDAMNLFVYKPAVWKATDKRSAFIYYFGGGWTKGTPLKAASVAAWAAQNGMVGIAPDYRTKNRFNTNPLASVADGREAFNWVVEHADELGIDPTRIAVGGTSAGGHVAMWTAIEKSPPGSDPAKTPKVKPAAIFLSSAVTDTSTETGYTSSRFGDDALALSPVHQLDTKMPPIVMFHAANDELVHYSTAVALYNKMKSTGNACELITVPVGGHGFSSEFPEWKPKVQAKLRDLLNREGLLPAMR